MKTKRRICALLLCLILVTAAACGGNNDNNSGNNTNSNSNQQTNNNDSGAVVGTVTASEGVEPVDPDEFIKTLDTLNIQMLGQLNRSTRAPVDDRLTPIWREKTKVIPEIIEIPAGQDATTWLQMMIVAGTVPDVIANQNGVLESAENQQTLKNAGMIREIKLDDMIRYMPRTAERLAKYGLTLEDWYNAAKDPSDGKLWVIPSLPSPLFSEEYRNSKWGENSLGSSGYACWFRDDILKMVYPDVMNAAELKAKAIEHNGSLSIEEIIDIPIFNLDDLFDYLVKVKELNLKTAENALIIPGHMHFNNSPGALYWSLFSATDLSLSYQYPLVINEHDGRSDDYHVTPEWKNYISFMNKCFNNGLLGSEYFTQKDEQRESKIVNGEYAVVNMWHPIGANQAKTATTGEKYDWRYYPIFYKPIDATYQDAARQYLDLYTIWNYKSFNAKTVTEEMMPQLLFWVDWHYSEEAAQLREWGSPDMYEGEGVLRRYKPEYKKVEEYKLENIQDSTGDGWYYGIVGQDNTMWNHEVYGLTMAWEMGDVYAPQYVYPFDERNYSAESLVSTAWAQENYKNMDLYARLPKRDETRAAYAANVEANEALNNAMNLRNDDLDMLTIRAITGPEDKFEQNYQAYIDVVTQPEVLSALDRVRETWTTYYNLLEGELEKIN